MSRFMLTFLKLLLLTQLVNASEAKAAERIPANREQKPSLTNDAQIIGIGHALSAAAIARTSGKVVYDPSYRVISYPGGDVPANRGVCSDLVVRSVRRLGVDLQRAVHEDMTAAFHAYPQIWGAVGPDANIDHRRVPNLATFFRRLGSALPASNAPRDYQAGDIVAWDLRAGAGVAPHIGIVTDRIGPSGWPLVVHNIGRGPELEDVLFLWDVTGRYRLTPESIAPLRLKRTDPTLAQRE